MLSFTHSPPHFFALPTSFTDMNPQVFSHVSLDGNSRRKKLRLSSLHFVAVKESVSSLGLFEVRNRNFRDFYWSCGGFVRRCKKGWESEGNFALEADILEFMKNSENPDLFPSKKQLIDSGRMDLVEAIMKQGGWLASGWDLDDNANEEASIHSNYDIDMNMIKDRKWKNEMIEQTVSESDVERIPEASISHVGSYSSASSSGRSFETAVVEDSGIDGILSRLEKERNINFGFGLRERGESTRVQSNDVRHNLPSKSSKNGTVVDLERNSGHTSSDPNNGTINDLEGKLSLGRSMSKIDGFRHSLKPDGWRIWSAERAGFSEMKFEADEILPYGTITRGEKDALDDEIFETREVEPSSHERISSNRIKVRLQHLEAELSSVLDMLRSNTDETVSKTVHQCSSDELLSLSDAWEFQETEILNAQHKLRSIRAKLAVLEGKLALAIIDAQKIMEEKQKRVDNARKALQLLRTACIVWPNSASEVLLAGSFDGWATKIPDRGYLECCYEVRSETWNIYIPEC